MWWREWVGAPRLVRYWRSVSHRTVWALGPILRGGILFSGVRSNPNEVDLSGEGGAELVAPDAAYVSC
jgi:hypothetical protein